MMTTEEKMLPSVGEQEKEEGKDDNEKEDEGGKSSDEESEKQIESSLHDAGEKIALPAQVEKNKKADVLNLNNEVVKMRKEVKRVKVFIIRKLARNINALKKKKGKEADVVKNQRRANRLLEEVLCMKKLLPDQVTKTALQKNLSFEQVCKNPKSTVSDRAVARIATHPLFVKQIERIKAAVKAFKKERVKSWKQGKEKANLPPLDTKRGEENEEKQETNAAEPQDAADSEEGGVFKITKDATSGEEIEKAAQSGEDFGVDRKEMTESKSVKSTSVKSTLKKNSTNHKPQSKAGGNDSDLQSAPAVHHKRPDEEEFDVELSDDEEKEYFDDSTEERFHKESSQSDMSDDDDDFFVGKVSKFNKKKKKQTGTEEEKKVDREQEEKKGSTDNVRTSNKLQDELDELESRLKSKTSSLQSGFCSSLSRAKAGRGSDRGRGGGRFRGQGRLRAGSGVDRESFRKQTKFQKQERGASNSGYKSDRKEGRGRGRGRKVEGHTDHRAAHVSDRQAQKPLLHPSWEASKKRKEQQSQILAFQGKKIKFND